jgi:hypothetical protein
MRLPHLLFTMRRAMTAFVIAAIALLINVALTAAPPAQTQVKRIIAPAEVGDDIWEERKARAREDIEYLEAYYRAKQAESRAAELHVASSVAYKTDIERQKQKGYTSTFVVKQGDINLADCEAQFELRRVELKDAEIRLARSRRRLKAIERSRTVDGSEPLLSSEDRFRELEVKYELLRSEFDQVKRRVPQP